MEEKQSKEGAEGGRIITKAVNNVSSAEEKPSVALVAVTAAGDSGAGDNPGVTQTLTCTYSATTAAAATTVTEGTTTATNTVANVTNTTSFDRTEGTYGGGKEDILELMQLLKDPNNSNMQRFRCDKSMWAFG